LTRGVAGSARLTCFASFILHPLSGGVAGGTGLAADGPFILHLLPWRAILRALCNAEGGRAEDQAYRDRRQEDFISHCYLLVDRRGNAHQHIAEISVPIARGAMPFL